MAININEMTNYYDTEYRGMYMQPADLAALLPYAYNIVNNAIALSGYTVDTVPEHLTGAVNHAICAEAEYLYGHGGLDALAGGESGGSMSLGAFSYSGASKSQSANELSTICFSARSYLQLTGLLCKGVAAI